MLHAGALTSPDATQWDLRQKTDHPFRFCYRRPMAVSERVDAQRNRARLVAATRTLLARDGLDVSVREIARETGVGVGTVYRHFPTREDLIDAVLEDAFEEIIAAAERALAEEDAWLAFSGFIERRSSSPRGTAGSRTSSRTRGGAAGGRRRCAHACAR